MPPRVIHRTMRPKPPFFHPKDSKSEPLFYQNNIYTSSMAHPQCLATACCFQLAQEGLAGRHLGFDVLIKLPSDPISQVDHGWSIWSIPTSPSSIHIPWHSAQGPTWRWNSRVNTGLESWDESMEICGNLRIPFADTRLGSTGDEKRSANTARDLDAGEPSALKVVDLRP